jgi:hypothetical protein
MGKIAVLAIAASFLSSVLISRSLNEGAAEGSGALWLHSCCGCGCGVMQSIQVEIYVAGDGKNYPKHGQTAVFHYTGYVSVVSCASPHPPPPRP